MRIFIYLLSSTRFRRFEMTEAQVGHHELHIPFRGPCLAFDEDILGFDILVPASESQLCKDCSAW